MSYPKSRIGKHLIKKADLLRDLDPALVEVESELGALANDTVDTLADLAALPRNQTNHVVRVASLGCSFLATPVGTSVADGITVINGNGAQWQRILATSDQRFQSQTDWYIDAINGNDESPGTAALPLKSAFELQRRWGSPAKIRTLVTVTIVSPIDEVHFNVQRHTAAGRLYLRSLPTTILDTTLSSVSNLDVPTNHWLNLQAVGIADWTPYLENRIRFPDKGDAVVWVAKANPEGLGNAVTRCNLAYAPSSGNFPTAYTPIVGDRILIETLPAIQKLSVTIEGPNFSDPIGITPFVRAIICESLNVRVTCSFGVPPNPGRAILIFGSYLRRPVSPFCANAYASYYASCLRIDHIETGGYYGCVLLAIPGLSRINCDGFTIGTQFVSTLFQGIGLYVLSKAYFSTVGFFDCPAEPLRIQQGAFANLRGSVVGRDNVGAGVVVYRSGQLVLDATNVPALTGTLGQISLSNNLGIWNWSDVPIYFGEGSGTATLVAGTVNVIQKNMPADARITLGRNTPGGALGELSAPQASRINAGTPTAQFTINSASPTDTSTVDYQWDSTSIGSGSITRDT